jgi:hypothetical protein
LNQVSLESLLGCRGPRLEFRVKLSFRLLDLLCGRRLRGAGNRARRCNDRHAEDGDRCTDTCGVPARRLQAIEGAGGSFRGAAALAPHRGIQVH